MTPQPRRCPSVEGSRWEDSMASSFQHLRWLVLAVTAACGSTQPADTGIDVQLDAAADIGTEGSPDTNMDVVVTRCTAHIDCNDGLFCNGEEQCAPASPMADARGCLSALA